MHINVQYKTRSKPLAKALLAQEGFGMKVATMCRGQTLPKIVINIIIIITNTSKLLKSGARCTCRFESSSGCLVGVHSDTIKSILHMLATMRSRFGSAAVAALLVDLASGINFARLI